MSIDSIIITEEIARLQTKGCCFTQLLDDPVHGRAGGCSEVNDPPPAAVIDNEEDVEDMEVKGCHSEEINCPGHVEMISEEWQPGC